MTSYYKLHAIISTDSGFNIVFFDVIYQPAQIRYSTFPCAEHSNELPFLQDTIWKPESGNQNPFSLFNLIKTIFYKIQRRNIYVYLSYERNLFKTDRY